MFVYTIYDNPADHPGRVVLRRFNVTGSGTRPDPEPIYVGDSVSEARALLPRGLARFDREKSDPACVVETHL
jgi:hypothetical protein